LLGAVASGALAVGALSGAGAANATCASISGFGNSANCQSSVSSFAVALGSGARAYSYGLLNGAVSVGPNTYSSTDGGALNLAYAGANNSDAETQGNLNFVFAQGKNVYALAGTSNADLGNTAINIGNADSPGENGVGSFGTGNLAVNLFGNGTLLHPAYVEANGVGNLATNVVGNGNIVKATGVLNNSSNTVGNNNVVKALGGTGLTSPGLNLAFNAFGNGNKVTAGALPSGGPFAIAGNVGRDNTVVAQPTTGISINKP